MQGMFNKQELSLSGWKILIEQPNRFQSPKGKGYIKRKENLISQHAMVMNSPVMYANVQQVFLDSQPFPSNALTHRLFDYSQE